MQKLQFSNHNSAAKIEAAQAFKYDPIHSFNVPNHFKTNHHDANRS